MAEEYRVVLKNYGKIDPGNIDDYIAAGGYKAFSKALKMEPEAVIDELIDSGLRGRGGAGFSTGLKKRFTSQACLRCENRYVICNADEGEPGTWKDRIIMEYDPHMYLEGLLIAAWSIRATKGYLYIRGEYFKAIDLAEKAIAGMRRKGFLGDDILGSGFSFDIEIRKGAGSYLCGEELTLLESLEGKRGYPRIKPPYPAEKGLWNSPTLINNVETFGCFPAIISRGAGWYRSLGTEKSPGTKIFTISGPVKNPGFFEVEMGTTLGSLIFNFAGGMIEGKTFRGAILGGAAGTFIDESMLDCETGFDKLKERGATLGSGAIIVMDTEMPVWDMLYSILRFFEHESCGKCVPCRVGSRQLLMIMQQIKTSENSSGLKADLIKQAGIMEQTSLCPLGQSHILPIRSALHYFYDDL
ncbi:MAG: NADH-quinone oxidoreductase subunit F [Bacteroidales bacterium]